MNPNIKIEPEALRHHIMGYFGQPKRFDLFLSVALSWRSCSRPIIWMYCRLTPACHQQGKTKTKQMLGVEERNKWYFTPCNLTLVCK